ncbi:hypothetical protein Tco_1182171 [Tanacetum coccineum]
MPQNVAFQTDDLDAFDSNSDEAPGASAAFIAHPSSYELDVISEVPNSDYYQDNNVPNTCVIVESYFEQSTSLLDQDMEITSDSNIISYEQYLQETTSASVQNNTSTDEQTAMIMSVFDALSVQVAKYIADNLKHKDLVSHPAKAKTQGTTRKGIITTHWRLYRETKTCINTRYRHAVS